MKEEEEEIEVLSWKPAKMKEIKSAQDAKSAGKGKARESSKAVRFEVITLDSDENENDIIIID